MVLKLSVCRYRNHARQRLLDTLWFDPNAIASKAAAYTEDAATN
jgi:hypothetical protein